MPNTLTKIASYTAPTGGGNGVGFTSIPQTYTDLIIKASVRSITSGGYDSLGMYLNGSQANISNTFLIGSGTGISSSRSTYRAFSTINSALNNATVFTSISISILNYTSNNFKPILFETALDGAQSAAFPQLVSGLWSNTAAINSVTFDTATSGQNLAEFTTFTLYGIKNTP